MKNNWRRWIKNRPTSFCPGCGYGIILNYIALGLEAAKTDSQKLVAVSGIGCAGWITDQYLNANTVHTTHGRAIPLASGIKLAKPELTVLVVGGDGDLAAIGTNHLIHAARRDINIAVVCANNLVYGMTGGQASSTTPEQALTSTSLPGENRPLDLIQLVLAAGSSFTARYPALMLENPQRAFLTIKKALNHTGFAFIEFISPCVTHFNKRNEPFTNGLPAGIFKTPGEYVEAKKHL